VILPGLWRDLAERYERARNLVMRTALNRFASLNEFEARTSSQNGEDGILAEILRRMRIRTGYFVEFGVQDGSVCNTALLAAGGWSGVYIEADEADAARLAERYASSSRITTLHEFITAENIAGIFARADVPAEFDVLSIDIDGNDYWVWRALASYKPRVVVIEYNAEHAPPQRWVMKYDPSHRWDKTTYYGASLASYAALAATKGYSLVGTEKTGVNAFFIRDDCLRASGFRALSAAEGFHPVGYYGIHHEPGHVKRDGPFEPI
jgi:hypothetical protein